MERLKAQHRALKAAGKVADARIIAARFKALKAQARAQASAPANAAPPGRESELQEELERLRAKTSALKAEHGRMKQVGDMEGLRLAASRYNAVLKQKKAFKARLAKRGISTAVAPVIAAAAARSTKPKPKHVAKAALRYTRRGRDLISGGDGAAMTTERAIVRAAAMANAFSSPAERAKAGAAYSSAGAASSAALADSPQRVALDAFTGRAAAAAVARHEAACEGREGGGEGGQACR